MTWEAIAAIVAVVSLVANIIQAYSLKRRTDEVRVSGSVSTREQHEIVTSAHLDMTLKGYASKGDLNDAVGKLTKEINDSASRTDQARREDIGDLHDKVNETREDVSAVKQLGETHTAQLDRIETRLMNLGGSSRR
jgi:hypothetical protein